MAENMISLRQIRTALQNGPSRAENFPFGVDRAAKIREIRAADAFLPFREVIRAEAERAASTPTPDLPFHDFQLYETTGSRMEYERLYFDRRRRLLALALFAVVEESDEYIRALNDLIWEICNEFSWCVPAHLPLGLEAASRHRFPPEQAVDLFAAETAHALAETVYLLKNRLEPWVVHRVRKEIEHRVFTPLYHDPGLHGWEMAANNWAAVCAGSAGMAAMLLEEDPDRLAGMLYRALGAIGSFLEGFGPDGGCEEGAAYWNYGFGYFVYFAEMLVERTNGRLNLMQGEKIRNIAGFPLGIMLSGGMVVNYSDSDDRFELQIGLASKLKERFGLEGIAVTKIHSMLADGCYRYAHTLRNLFWSDLSLLRPDSRIPEGTVVFPDLEWVVDRRYLGGEMFAFSAKGGHNAEAHNHNDLGHFILHAAGENLLADLGSGRYTRQYFSSSRYESLHASSLGHSVPVINGQGQLPGRERKAQVLHIDTSVGRLSFGLELAGAYGVAGLDSLQRFFVWQKREAQGAFVLELTDVFRFRSQPSSIEELFISRHEPEISEGRIVWRGARAQVEMRYDAAQWTAELERLTDVNHQGEPIEIFRARLRNPDPKPDVRFHAEWICMPK